MDDQKHPTIEVKITPRMASEANITFSVNGIAQSIPTGVFTPIREDMLEALTNSDMGYLIETRPAGEQSSDAPAGSEGGAAGAPALAASASDGQSERSGPDDLHGKPHVDKDYAPQGYQPQPGVFGADEQLAAAADAEIPGGELESPKDGETFDADAVIGGTVKDVVARLDALTPEQRKQVLAAEQDREQPRKGVLDALGTHDAA